MYHGFWDYDIWKSIDLLLVYHGIYWLCWKVNTIAYNGQEHTVSFGVFVLRRFVWCFFKLTKKDINFWNLFVLAKITSHKIVESYQYALLEKCLYLEFLWSVFSGIWAECRKTWSRKPPNTDIFYAGIPLCKNGIIR